jgi:photosystem II Psb27 protein
MFMKRSFVRVVALVFALCIGWFSNPSVALAADSLTGNYSQDTLAVVENLRAAINIPNDSPDRGQSQVEARKLINEFAARYRRNSSVLKLNSFTTMRTALNSLAGHYSSYPNRPVPKKLKDRLETVFGQVELAVKRGN